MAGRCVCSSNNATGCAAIGDTPIDVTGAGTVESPFEFSLDPAYLPLIVCTSVTRPASPAEGQLIYETDSGYVRVWDGAEWANVWGGAAVRVVADPFENSWGDATEAAVPFGGETYKEPTSWHSTTVDSSRLVAPFDGLYDVGAYLDFATNAVSAAHYFSRIQVNGNGAAIVSALMLPGTDPGIPNILSHGGQWVASAGDYFEVTAYQATGGDLDLHAEFWAKFLGPV